MGLTKSSTGTNLLNENVKKLKNQTDFTIALAR